MAALQYQNPITKQAQVSVANTNRDGTGTLVDVLTGTGALGVNIDNISITAAGTTTAGVVRLFIDDGVNTYLFREYLVSAITPSTVVKVFSTSEQFSLYNFVIPKDWVLKASTHNAETFNIVVNGGQF